MAKNSITITRLSVYPLEGLSNNLVGTASISIDNAIQVRGIRIYRNERGLYCLWPGRTSNDKFYPSVKPVTEEVRVFIQDAIIAEYNSIMANRKSE